jgi:photosystem II stability/assembly factor-like uncharacterized protein
MRSSLPLSVFFLLIPLGLLWGDWPQERRENRRTPLPTENRMEAHEERSHNRKAWFKERHRAPDGVDWLAMERANGEAQVKKRRLPAPPAEGPERWVERGSTNQAGRTHSGQRLADGTLYVGSALGGLWKQPPGGEWAPLGDNLYGGVHWLGVLEEEGALPTILAGTDWGALHRTTNDGQSWETPTGVPSISELRRMVVAPDERIYLITGSWGNYRLFRSDDRGASFQSLRSAGSAPPDLWTPRDQPGALYLYSDNGLEVSEDGGESWIERGTISEEANKFWLVGSEAGAEEFGGHPRLYLLAEKSGTWLWTSDDGGQTWTKGAKATDYWGNLEASRVDRDLFVCGGFEVYRSQDGGQTLNRAYDWTVYYDFPATSLHADLMGLDVEPDGAGGELWYIHTDGGTYVSADGLDHVQNLSMSGLRISQYYSTLTSPSGRIAAGAQDQGYQLSESETGGLYSFSQEISGDYGHLSSPDNTLEWVFSTYPGFVLVQMGEDRPRFEYLDFPSGATSAWLPPVVAAAESPGEFYFPADKLYRYSYSRGNWSPELWSEQDFSVQRDEYLSALAFSPVDPQRAYAVSSYGVLWWSEDQGKTWNKSVDGGPGGQYFYGTALLASRSDALTAWVGGSGYGSPAVYKTTDGGKSWSAWAEGLPDTLVYALAEAPDGSGRIAAGTETAAYLRGPEDAGWTDITGSAAPITTYWSVETLVAENTFRFGTYGRGIWDYQLDPEHTGCYPVQDFDGDGTLCTEDCDDHDATRHPGAEDLCDGVDQNCNLAEEADEDGDGYWGCTDCDDTRAALNPKGSELCGDGLDQDCDGRDLACKDAEKSYGCSSGGELGWFALVGLAALRRRFRSRAEGARSPR